MLNHHIIPSDEALVAWCSNPNSENLGCSPYGNRVVRISEQAVVKYGPHVTELEANNQRAAYDILNASVVRVPKIYRFFSLDFIGYIVMENIKGFKIDPLEDTSRIRKVAEVLAQFEHITSLRPGPLHGTLVRGPLWPENEDIYIHSVKDLESFFTSRLGSSDFALDLTSLPFSLCHLDVSPRNLLWLPDDTLCLLDWESAGFYPRLFEVCEQRALIGKDGDFNRVLLEHIKSLTTHEEKQVAVLLMAYHNMQRYYLHDSHDLEKLMLTSCTPVRHGYHWSRPIRDTRNRKGCQLQRSQSSQYACKVSVHVSYGGCACFITACASFSVQAKPMKSMLMIRRIETCKENVL